jgi:hypothetical protein
MSKHSFCHSEPAFFAGEESAVAAISAPRAIKTFQTDPAQKINGRPKPAFSINLNTNYGFLGAIESLTALATRNFTTVLALI